MKLARYALGALLLLPFVAVGQTVDLNVTPTSGVESVTPTVTWTSSGVTACTAGGGWSGTKETSGSETLPAIDRSASYSLLCTTATGQAVLTWTAPTENTNGTPLTDLAKYRIYTADTATNLGATQPVEVPASVRTYTFPTLPQGTKFFAVTAVSAADIESALSNVVSKNITGSSATDQAAVEVTPRPKAPVVAAP